MFINYKLIRINNSVNQIMDLPETINKNLRILDYQGATTGFVGMVKETVDFTEAIVWCMPR